MARIGLVLHPRRDCSPAVNQVLTWTSTNEVELVASADDVTRLGLGGLHPVSVEELAGTCDGIIALGGDGTLLGAMRLVVDRPVPVLGVNFGNLGFLTEVEGADLDAALGALADGRVTTDLRECLVVRHGEGESIAFNDVVLARVPGEGMVEATLSVAGRRYGHYRCDSLILATPMGSTAYNYAAGGPVVSPGVQGILVTPSAPLNGIARSLLLGPGEPLRLELTDGHPAVELDGVLTGRLEPGRVLEVELRPDAGRLVRIEGSRAADRSRVKLSLLDLPLLPQELLELVPEGLRRRLADAD
ncbi:NAD(+)/NADH kinase [Blastococcus sp. CT_GayMR20]|uniref:NAD(+)/NADH kinase n=1 Tax=Blastococcus sp. CT_GayMR20 TaxID=2559609 RepID=UPI001073B58A|nr:NAD(+)/NADH kinase [Blastococcus sp. CT_GayMR20]TFV85922.1 NAD(+)/NADH kinase [Blastococcus sp. CT_GayMR20]